MAQGPGGWGGAPVSGAGFAPRFVSPGPGPFPGRCAAVSLGVSGFRRAGVGAPPLPLIFLLLIARLRSQSLTWGMCGSTAWGERGRAAIPRRGPRGGGFPPVAGPGASAPPRGLEVPAHTYDGAGESPGTDRHPSCISCRDRTREEPVGWADIPPPDSDRTRHPEGQGVPLWGFNTWGNPGSSLTARPFAAVCPSATLVDGSPPIPIPINNT